MTDGNIRKRLTEGIVKLVEELIDYKTEVNIGGFIKITADKCNVFPITLREYKKKEISPMEKRKKVTVGRGECNKERPISKSGSKKRKLSIDATNNVKVKTPSKKLKSMCNETTEMAENSQAGAANVETSITDQEIPSAADEHSPIKKPIRRKERKPRDDAEVERSFPCVVCRSQGKDVVFNTEHKLFTHGRIDHRDKLRYGYKCQECNQTFRSFFKLHNHHYHRHSKIKNYSCKSCSKQFIWALEIRRHSKEHESVTHMCMKCPWPGKSFYNYSRYAYHIKTGHKETKCKKCDETFKSREDLRNHFREAHIIQRIKRRKRKMAEIVKGKTIKEVKLREVPKPQIGLSEADKNTVFLRTVRSKSGKETKVKCKITLSIVVVLCCFHIASIV